MTAESNFLINSREWFLIKPKTMALGDSLFIQGNTDIDSISFSFGGVMQKDSELSAMMINSQKMNKGVFQGFKVVEQPKDKVSKGYKLV